MFQTGCVLVQTKEVTMNPSDAQRVFTSDNYEKAVLQGKSLPHCKVGSDVML